MKNFIELKNVSFAYDDEPDKLVLKNINLNIEKGKYTAIIGHNGSGKSTMSKLINGLFLPTSGDIITAGYNTKNEENSLSIKKSTGLVFQNPDNQIIATTVEEDIAFGPENIGISRTEMIERIKECLNIVGLSGYEKKAPHLLSGGQKQRVAIAGALAIRPDCIIFDESTSMLDPGGRKDIVKIMNKLVGEGKTVINITHFMDEVLDADYVVVLNKGEIYLEGKPEDILIKEDELRSIGLASPTTVRIYNELKKLGITLDKVTLSNEEVVNKICQLL